MILFSNLNPSDNTSTMFLSFFESFYDNKKIGIQNYDIYNEMIIIYMVKLIIIKDL